MTLWYNPPKKDDTFGTIKGSYENCISTFEFSEGLAWKDDKDNYYLLMLLTSTPTDVKQYGNNDLNLTDTRILMTFHNQEYEKSVKDSNGNYVKEPVKPNDLELVVCKLLDDILEKPIKGSLNLIDNGKTLSPILSGKLLKKHELVDMTDTEYQFYCTQILEVELIEDSQLKPVTITTSYGGKTKQSYNQGDGLTQRFNWLADNLGIDLQGVKTLVELYSVINTIDDKDLKQFLLTVTSNVIK